MNVSVKKLNQPNDNFAIAIDQWLSGEVTGHLGPYMYTVDSDDKRWKRGHSSPAYYLGTDDKATFDMAVRELDITAENLIDLGPGGEASVLAKSLPLLEKIKAPKYLPVDLSATLAQGAVDIAATNMNVSGQPVIADFFRPMSLRAPNSLLAFMGGTLANIETYQDKNSLQNRLAGIFENFTKIVVGQGYMMISFDANTNAQQIVDCYANPELGDLIKSCVERAMNVENFDYDVVWTAENYQLATGLRSKRDQIIYFNGCQYSLEKDEFLPVLNSYRFPENFVKAAAARAGWNHVRTWSATGRTHYLLFSINR